MKRSVFVVGSSGPQFDRFHEAVAKALVQASTVVGIDLEELEHGGRDIQNITDYLTERIRRADLVLADVSGESPWVAWELGVAQALGKPTLLVAQDAGNVPFDVRWQHLLLYRPSDPAPNIIARLTDALVDTFRRILDGSGEESAKLARSLRTVFISYSHADIEFLHRILVHLRPIERQGQLDLWSDTKIKAGDMNLPRFRRHPG